MQNRNVVILLLAIVTAAVSGYLAVTFGGLVNIAATDKHSPIVEWTLRTTMRNAVRRAAQELKVPNLEGEETIRRGAKMYDEMCVACHAAPGKPADDELADGLNPKPPEIEKIVPDRTSKELFWVTKHGIKMTGMPAWGPSHKDDEIWAMVAFMRAMPKMEPQDYERILGRESTSQPPPHSHQHGTGHEQH